MVEVKDDKIVAESVLLSPTTEPTIALEGKTYFDNTEKKVRYYDGTEWVSL